MKIQKKTINNLEENLGAFKFEGRNYRETSHLSKKELFFLIKKKLNDSFNKQAKFSITTKDRRFDVKIIDLSFNPFNDTYSKYLNDELTYEEYRNLIKNDYEENKYNSKYKELRDKIEDLINSYNFDDSDSQSDYFHVNFYYSVVLGNEVKLKYFPNNKEAKRYQEYKEQEKNKRLKQSEKRKNLSVKFKKNDIVKFKKLNHPSWEKHSIDGYMFGQIKTLKRINNDMNKVWIFIKITSDVFNEKTKRSYYKQFVFQNDLGYWEYYKTISLADEQLELAPEFLLTVENNKDNYKEKSKESFNKFKDSLNPNVAPNSNLPQPSFAGLDRDLTQIEVRKLMQSLIDCADPFVYKIFSEKNYNNDFNNDGIINTPVGEVQLNYNQIQKIYDKDRVGYYGLIKPTLTKPLLVLPSWDKNKVKATTFIKTFVDKKNEKIYFLSITRNSDGLLNVVSNYRKKEEQVKKILVKGYKYKSYQSDNVTSLQDLGAAKLPKPLLVFVQVGIPFTVTNLSKNIKFSKNNTGKEISPNKSVKASLTEAIKQVSSLPKFKNVGPMAISMFYNKFKNKKVDETAEINRGLENKIFEKLDNAGFVEFYARMHKEAILTESGFEAIKSITARYETLKAKKSGTDLFPELNGINDVGLQFIERFVNFHNKKVLESELEQFINDVNLAVKTKKLTKSHPYASKINNICQRVYKVYKEMPSSTSSLVLNIKDVTELTEILEKEKNGLGILPIAVAAATGKVVEHLINKGLSGSKEKFKSKIKKVFTKKSKVKSPKKYKIIGTEVFKVTPEGTKHISLSGVLTTEQMAGIKYEELKLNPYYAKILGKPATNFDMCIHGEPGAGKTVFLLKLANNLAENFGKVVYITTEEFGSATLTKKINDFDIKSKNLYFTDKISKVNPSDFQFVFIDSVNHSGLKLSEYQEIRKKAPKTAFILILQTTKGGDYKGGKDWPHEVEICARLFKNEKGQRMIEITKDRYSDLRTVKI